MTKTIDHLRVEGLLFYHHKGVCTCCGRDTEPVIEFQYSNKNPTGSQFALCSDCCQVLMAIHEEHSL